MSRHKPAALIDRKGVVSSASVFSQHTPSMISSRPRSRILLLLGAMVLAACGPTGNRLNTGVISDPRLQPDTQSSTGNQGTTAPSQGSDTTPANPQDTAIPTDLGSGGTNANASTSSGQTAGILSRPVAASAIYRSSHGWQLTRYPGERFRLDHAARRLAGHLDESGGALKIDADTDGLVNGQGIAIVDTGTGGLVVIDGTPLHAPEGLILLSRSDRCPGPSDTYNRLPLADAGASSPPSITPCRASSATSGDASTLLLATPSAPVGLAALAGRYRGLMAFAGQVSALTVDCDDFGHCRQLAGGAVLDWRLTAFNEPRDGFLAGTFDLGEDTVLLGRSGPLRCIVSEEPSSSAVHAMACTGRLRGGPRRTLLLQRFTLPAR